MKIIYGSQFNGLNSYENHLRIEKLSVLGTVVALNDCWKNKGMYQFWKKQRIISWISEEPLSP